MRRVIKNTHLLLLGLTLIFTTSKIFSQSSESNFESFVELFPKHYLPFTISENELSNLDKTNLKVIPEEYRRFLPQNFSSRKLNTYAYASVELDNGRFLLFHLEESTYPFVRKVFMTIFSNEGFPVATELFAAYENGVEESFTYAIVNESMLMHRTTKTFKLQSNEVNIKTDKFRLNNIGEIVAL